MHMGVLLMARAAIDHRPMQREGAMAPITRKSRFRDLALRANLSWRKEILASATQQGVKGSAMLGPQTSPDRRTTCLKLSSRWLWSPSSPLARPSPSRSPLRSPPSRPTPANTSKTRMGRARPAPANPCISFGHLSASGAESYASSHLREQLGGEKWDGNSSSCWQAPQPFTAVRPSLSRSPSSRSIPANTARPSAEAVDPRDGSSTASIRRRCPIARKPVCHRKPLLPQPRKARPSVCPIHAAIVRIGRRHLTIRPARETDLDRIARLSRNFQGEGASC